MSADSIRSEKLKVLKSLRHYNDQTIHSCTLRAQYTQGKVDNKLLLGYLEEEGANPLSQTETYVAVKTYIDNWRWSGVPFYLTTGKRLAKKRSEVVIYFKQQPYNIFKRIKDLSPNQLILRLQPDEGVTVQIINKIPGLGTQLQLHDSELNLNFNHMMGAQRIADAYERLIMEVMLGNQYLFVSREEIEQAWTWIDGIRALWQQEVVPLHTYAAGTWGPAVVEQW